ncbi:hypothetical protein PDQ75_27240 [Bacillus cereus group sp. Bc015]|uniref:hypothetical protein n=1 Tax=Bacillus cereus group sp. Bc015 TaxID=3018123 RepID=UPI0022E0CEAD|nr:hypothetical protein [Bacillus cereus group sp. Bc015]MDA2738833.1 hypothetical protein [Bacillus cereus group sp. Bc015]
MRVQSHTCNELLKIDMSLEKEDKFSIIDEFVKQGFVHVHELPYKRGSGEKRAQLTFLKERKVTEIKGA